MNSDAFIASERESGSMAVPASSTETATSAFAIDINFFSDEDGMRTPTRPGSPSSSSSSVDLSDIFPKPTFSHPPSPPRPGQQQRLQQLIAQIPFPPPPPRQLTSTLTNTEDGERWRLTFSDEGIPPRKAVTSIAGSSRCLWPPDSTFLTMSDTFKERAYQYPLRSQGAESTVKTISVDSTACSSTSTSTSPAPSSSQKNHPRSDSFQDTVKRMTDWQPCRKARRVMDGPYFKERNRRVVAEHVRKLIQDAVEDGVGELDLSYLELTDLPSDICDLNFAIVYNERGSFSLSKNRLKLFLSCNRFTTIPMDVFALHNLSVLSLRNNNIQVIPPEIGLLHNLVELSLGGNLLVCVYHLALTSELEAMLKTPSCLC
ncbi:hypothetical protein BGX28_001381 [Mortierella sp. GBA30]|nr:hypothetical protein BGX28_001381 [Mortierella sp. GBA30]